MIQTKNTFLTERQLKFLKEIKKGKSMQKIAKKYGFEKSEIENEISKAIKNAEKAKNTVKIIEEKDLEEIMSQKTEKEEEKLLKFVKKYRDKEWINYMLETRGKQAILEEAKRLKNQHKNEWIEFREN